MNVTEKITYFGQVWQTILPHIPMPSLSQRISWTKYSPKIIESAIQQTGKRFSVKKVSARVDPAQCYKFVSATAESLMFLVGLAESMKESRVTR